MSFSPPGPNRANCGYSSVQLSDVLRRVFDSVGFIPDDEAAIGQPGSYSGTARCGGNTFRKAVTYFASEVMSKFDDKSPESNDLKTKAALSKFHEAEALCSQTNQRFDKYFYGHRPEKPDVATAVVAARDLIWRLLGDIELSEVISGSTFTSGGSVCLRRASGSSVHKYSAKAEVTSTSFSLLQEVFPLVPLWVGNSEHPGVINVPGNKLTCVPKNYKTHRMIAGEPSGSMYLQKGIHTALRKRLLRVGIDLSNQTQNQDFARLGSKTGLVATVDMSMASDTVAKTMVEWFLDLNPSWLELMNLTRSAEGVFAGDRVIYRKFSSMGNAYTFELETLIFWALAIACCKSTGSDRRFVAVYGDDVIIPNAAVPLFLDVLSECGFVPNVKKTFFEERQRLGLDRFRESCGKHFYNGEDVTPVYIKSAPLDLMDYFHLVNNLVRWFRTLEAITDAPDLSKGWELINDLRALAPERWRKPRIPDGFGDGAFIGEFDECAPTRHRGNKRQWEGWSVEVLTERFDKANRLDENGDVLLPYTRKGTTTWKPHRDPKIRKEIRRYVKGVTFRGYLLSSLERLEKGRPPWHRHTRILDLANAARRLQEYDTGTEARGIELPPTRQVCMTKIVIAQW